MIAETVLYLTADNTKYIEISILDASTIIITGKYAINDRVKTNDTLVSICLEDLLIEVGSPFTVTMDNTHYQFDVVKILEVNNTFKIITTLRNKSRLFILPLLGNDYKFFSIDKYLINTFLVKEESEVYNKLFLLYFSKNTEEYVTLEDRLFAHLNFIQSYECDNNTLMEFDVPTEFQFEVETFVQGLYSKFRVQNKHKILNFWKNYSNNTVYNLINKVFAKDKTVVKELYGDIELPENSEVLSKPDLSKEFYKPSRSV
jgi:hypothetical protein